MENVAIDLVKTVQQAAEKVYGRKKGKRKQGKINKPWFDLECRKLHQQLLEDHHFLKAKTH